MAVPSSTSSPSSQFELIQWNCRGFGNRQKRSHLLLFLQSRGSLPAVLALQEAGLNPSLSSYCSYSGGPTTSILVHKSYTAVQVDLDLTLQHDYSMVTVLPSRRRDPPIHVLNVYCPPHLPRVTFSELFYRALNTAARDPLVIVGDFNAPSLHWGYHYEKARARIVRKTWGTARLTDWPAFRTQSFLPLSSPDGYRKLKARIAALTEEAAAYAAHLSDTNWVETCTKAASQMGSRGTWRLFRSLLDPSSTRGETQRQLRRALHGFPGTSAQLADKLRDRYLCRTVDLQRLQQAASIVDTYATSCGLECAPQKSALLSLSSLPPPRLSLPTGPIPVVTVLRVLGLFISSSLNPGSTLTRLRRMGEQVSRMIRRVSTKRGGLRGRDALRLAQAFVISRIITQPPTSVSVATTRPSWMPSSGLCISVLWTSRCPLPTVVLRLWVCTTPTRSFGRLTSLTNLVACLRRLLGAVCLRALLFNLFFLRRPPIGFPTLGARNSGLPLSLVTWILSPTLVVGPLVFYTFFDNAV
ncbi:hypothetical protein HPB49_014323 [Dermacentor silvarum]|uniref:Uncharacterized protein n=1 Tax=Dermacentor silvarum TaxID=543639 RepID=A0ACB8CLB2_DERSI|nr:hypothetical protein HPB49_014323 [Dermacentor silvarum]